jgi:hypothetical protein
VVFARLVRRISDVSLPVHFLIVAGLLFCPAVSAQTDADREAARIIGVDEPLNMLDKVNKTLTDKVNSIKNFFTRPKDSDPSGENSADINRQRLVDMGEEGRRKGVEDCVKYRATTFGDQSNRKNCEAVYLLPEDPRTRPPEQAERPDLEVAEPAERLASPGKATQMSELSRRVASNLGSAKFFSDRLLAECSEGQLSSSCSRYLQGADEVAATTTGLLTGPDAAQLLPFEKNALISLKIASVAAAIRERRANPSATGCKPGMGAAVNCVPAEETAAAEKAAADKLAAGNDAPPVVLPRRGGNAGTDLFQNSIAQSEQEERDRPVREAREKAERERLAEQQRLAQQQLAEQQRLASTQRSAPSPTPAPATAPQQSAKDQLIASLDQRIASTRQRCLASESSCNSGCLGVGAIGIFSALTGNRAAASASQDQLQQCSNRCDQAKSDCDQRVLAIENEKRVALGQTPMRAAASAGPTSSNISGGVQSGETWQDVASRVCQGVKKLGVTWKWWDGTPADCTCRGGSGYNARECECSKNPRGAGC